MSAVVDSLTGTGRFLDFVMSAVRATPHTVRHYPGEIVQQTGAIIRSNALVICFMLAMLGGLFTMAINFLFGGLGLDSYLGAAPPVVMLRGCSEVVFGWILAAKMGCGIVAELGSMRIGEEVDALEVMGVPSLPYLVVTKVLAALVVLPSLFVIGLGVNYMSSRWFGVSFLHGVSGGGFDTINYLFQGPREFFIAVSWSSLVAIGVTLIACYFGYTAAGGPVGVGHNTAKSMLVNLIYISVSAMVLAQTFYGQTPGSPLGN
ncbi:MAG TPA: ABC transporter permease [Nocardioides sp.]|nr:ABC transporter permease [Nocardioides sp.]